MKKSLYILGIAALSVMSSGCDKEFLDEQPTNNISLEQIAEAAKTDPTLFNSFVSGMYSTMYNPYTGGTTGHDDFGQKGYDIYSDLIASDMVLSGVNYGWYSTVVRYQATQDYSMNPAYLPWRYYYRMVFAANTLIDILGGNDAVQPDANRNQLMGQAKAMRAYAYYYLSHFYGPGYGNGSEKILPIYTTTTVPAQPKSTTADVYDQIIKDLDDAIVLLEGFNRKGKFEVNTSVAKGLLAYALTTRGTQADLTRAVQVTNDVIADGGFRLLNKDEVTGKIENGVLVNPQSGFNNVASPSWMWGMDLTLDIGLNLISWWGQVDVFTYSYAWAGDPKAIDRGLYESIKADDIRKGQFHATNLQPRNKFFHPARVIGGQRMVETDYVYMRIEEMYLLNAEAKAKLGNEDEAKTRLKELLAKRIEDYSYVDDLSGQALKDEIYLQTRIELWGEGKSYLALKRNRGTVTRGDNHLFNKGESFAWDAPQLTFPIPQAEVLNNPVLNN
jgi:starch-binding outer membrane protein, SusD/RagB family